MKYQMSLYSKFACLNFRWNKSMIRSFNGPMQSLNPIPILSDRRKRYIWLPEVLLLPVPAHLCLLMLGLDQLDVQVLGPDKEEIIFPSHPPNFSLVLHV